MGFLFVKSTLSKNPQKIFEQEQKHNLPSVGERIRKMCEELGPTFVKLGQILSTRTDIVTENVAKQLQKLQDSVAPFSYEEALGVIETELGDTVDKLFAQFDPVPLASASVSQVYRAKLYSGADVVVKVQRPNIRESIDVDLGILEKLARLVDKYSKYGQLYDFSGMVAEFRRVMEQETDFTKEGENTDYFRESVANQKDIRVPRIKWVYTTPKVLTMDYVNGVKINDIAALTAENADTSQIAYTFTDSLITQILENGVFHADPHPGNVLIVDGKIVEFIDLGMVGSINSRFRRQLNDLVLGIASRNTLKIAQSISEMDTADSDVNMDAFERSLDELLDEYLYVPLGEVKIAKVFTSVFTLAAKYKMKIPREFTLVAKCLGTAQGVVEELDPSINILEIAEKTVRNLLKNRYKTEEFKNEVQTYALDWIDFMKGIPSSLVTFMHKLKKNDYSLELKVKDMERMEKNIERMFNRISFAVVLLAVCIVMAGVIISAGYSNMGKNDPTIYSLSTFAIVVGLLISIVIVLGLVISMVKSGKKRK
ncbi:ABC1 kinase family protein [Christensenella hongkongensis]|uniref:Ubiquinone biosynthesis monooxygenase UbiB n=2 Tax=Christensenella hongkongensis TaxID=270498 RepID=A0A0M2NIS1_9FIRM|nr:AarF/ABC1/UbiB kinase family protein [Christensenella hongkongensis]KKI50337.1 Ubiquinone biosynthesis monooxygenase UbiB [Christensenella hongkongensis]TCW31200.1 2-octaprenylphenol hydroxylase [Christensenella hongkongensis]